MTNNHDDRAEYIQRFDRIVEANYSETDHDRRDRRRCHICPRPLVTADEIARGVCNTCHYSAFPDSDDLLLL